MRLAVLVGDSSNTRLGRRRLVMAKAKKPVVPFVKFEKDPKTGTVPMSRFDTGSGSFCLQFPRPDAKNCARLLYEGDDPKDVDCGLFLDYSDVQWLAQAIPELLNEMERAGIVD